MTSGSSVSTCIALASVTLDRNLGGHPWELQGTANLILVLEAHATAHSTAPGARLQNGLDDQATTTSTGDRTIFSPERRSPTGADGTSGRRSTTVIWRHVGSSTWGRADTCPGR